MNSCRARKSCKNRSLDENQAGTTLSRFLLDGFLLHWSLLVTVRPTLLACMTEDNQRRQGQRHRQGALLGGQDYGGGRNPGCSEKQRTVIQKTRQINEPPRARSIT